MVSARDDRPVIRGIAHAVPQRREQEALWRDYFAAHYGGDERAARLWRSAGVQYRHGAIDPSDVDVARWSTGQRMAAFVTAATPLGKEAVAAALDEAGLPAADIGQFAVASCTGYATPGLDITLARDLAMPADLQRLAIGHMGCYAAIPGLGAVSDFVRSRCRSAVLLCCELPSLHVQPRAVGAPFTRTDLDQLAAHALFADAAAAVVVGPGPVGAQGLRLLDVAAVTDPSTAGLMSWDITDHGFRMALSPRVPEVLARHVGPLIADLLHRNRIGIGDIDRWVVHPGGPRILDVVADRLGLGDDALAESAGVLRDFGNCSSATVLLV
ncbi:MAG: type III polyketide synthase, partial [Mycobacteriales bacterium]